jgi:hypothetical protein
MQRLLVYVSTKVRSGVTIRFALRSLFAAVHMKLCAMEANLYAIKPDLRVFCWHPAYKYRARSGGGGTNLGPGPIQDKHGHKYASATIIEGR